VRYLSVCSGIEAASVAWESLGWTSVAFAEIEKFPSKVLAHHYPGVANLGDMTRFREWDIERDAVDVLVGGTPCQSFSVAGLRKGLDDPRGNLALTFIAMVDHYRPEWVIWENVPGVLSSSGGRDFGSFLGALGNIGYGFAYRVLDAQHFGVPQRRRRVFVVAHSSGDSRRAAEVLFEPESLRGDSTKGRKTGQDTAQCLTTGTGCRYDPNTETLIPITFRKSRRAQSAEDFETWVPDEVTNTLNCFDLGDVRSVDIVVDHPAHAFKIRGLGHYTGTNGGVAKPGTGGSGYMGQDEKAYTIATSQDQYVAHAFNHQSGGDMRGIDLREYPQLQAHQQTSVLHAMAVRRLTPTECERLQGFPDGYTDIMPETPDGPRYKALGNSMAVPVMRWIGCRIALATK
jgi:DNA (cytosine-5)-methyltransferase 1